jgi:hypothetical protein
LVPYKNVIELTAQEKELIANIKDLEDDEVLAYTTLLLILICYRAISRWC